MQLYGCDWISLNSLLGSITFCLTQSHQLPSPSYHGSSLIGHQPLVVVIGESLSGKNKIGFWFNFILWRLPDTAFELNLLIVSPSINSSHVGFWELSFLPVRLTNTMLQLKKSQIPVSFLSITKLQLSSIFLAIRLRDPNTEYIFQCA